jgi:hypothetical protein
MVMGIFDMERCSLCPGHVFARSWLEVFSLWNDVRPVMGMCPFGHRQKYFRHGEMFALPWGCARSVMAGGIFALE